MLKVPWHENFTLRCSNINPSSPSLPMVPKYLEITLCVKREVGIFEKRKVQMHRFGIFPFRSS